MFDCLKTRQSFLAIKWHSHVNQNSNWPNFRFFFSDQNPWRQTTMVAIGALAKEGGMDVEWQNWIRPMLFPFPLKLAPINSIAFAPFPPPSLGHSCLSPLSTLPTANTVSSWSEQTQFEHAYNFPNFGSKYFGMIRLIGIGEATLHLEVLPMVNGRSCGKLERFVHICDVSVNFVKIFIYLDRK